MKVRHEQAGDIEKIHEINLQTFGPETEVNLLDALGKSGIEMISLVY